jgi:hypothetical protein
MITKIENFLPEEVTEYYYFTKSLMESKDEWKYKFLPNDDFKEIDDVTLAAKIYWEEMLYRTHIVCLLSLFKAARWLESINNNNENYYGCCSCLRGLIESCADSFYTLRSVPLTIARDFKVISEIINVSSDVIIDHEKLENSLLHFIQATKLNSTERKKLPAEFVAKQIREYIESIDGCDGEVAKLYSYLCGISYPAYESTQVFLFLHEGVTIVCSDSNQFEIKLVESILDSSEHIIKSLFRVFYVNIFCVINLLNKFHIDSIFTPIAPDVIEGHSSWKEIQELIDLSATKYSEALKNRVYE